MSLNASNKKKKLYYVKFTYYYSDYIIIGISPENIISSQLKNFNETLKLDVDDYLKINRENFHRITINTPCQIELYSCVLSRNSTFYSSYYILWISTHDSIYNNNKYHGYTFKDGRCINMSEYPDLECEFRIGITPNMIEKLVIEQDIDQLKKCIEEININYVIRLSLKNGCVKVLKWLQKDFFNKFSCIIDDIRKLNLEKHYSLLKWWNNFDTCKYYFNFDDSYVDHLDQEIEILTLFLPRDIIHEIKNYC